jgi:hypothetical protein
MGEPQPKRAEPNAGAFLGPDLLIPVPMRTLPGGYRDQPSEPDDDREPPPEPPGLVARIRERLLHPAGRGGRSG